MIIESQIHAWAESFPDQSVFIVQIDWKPGSKKILVNLDGDENITIEKCRRMASFLSAKLDEADYGNEAYLLEVSSPGVDNSLMLPRQYRKHIGRELIVKLKSGTELYGRLESSGEEGIELLLIDKKKKKAGIPVTKKIPFGEIAESYVQISFK